MGYKFAYSFISAYRNKKAFSILSIAVLLLSYLLVFNLQICVSAQSLTLFSDGFETGDFSAWTNARSAGPGVSSSVQTVTTYDGTYAMKVAVADGAGESGVCEYIDLGSGYSTIDARVYVLLSASPASGGVLELFGFTSDGWIANALGTRIDAYNDNGILKWRVNYNDNGWHDQFAGTITLNTWYCVEVKLVMSNGSGETRLYVDGTEIITETGLRNIGSGDTVRYFALGLDDESGSNTLNAYFDCVVLANAYIGPEPSPTPTPTPMPSPSPTPTPNPNQTVYCTFNLTMTATVPEPVYKEANITKIIQASWIANDGILYAGSFATLYRSFDQGVTWQPLITFNSSNAAGIDCVYVNELNYLFTSPNSNATANELGLWKSIDGGGNWSKVLSLPLGCSIQSMDEDSNGNLFAGIYTTGSTGNASICKSADGGDHWQTVYYDSAARHVHHVTVDKSNNYIYASIGDVRVSPWNVAYVIRSTDDGNSNSSWKQILSGIPQILAIEAIPGARLIATDLDNGIIYRTTDDVSYNSVLNTGAQSYGFWIRTNNLNGNIYASFLGGESSSRNAGIYISNDSGLTWNIYKTFNIHNAYFGSPCGSNFFQGTMYYSVLLDSGWQNGTKIYPSFGLSPNQVESAVNLNLPTVTYYNDNNATSPSNDSSTCTPAADLSQLSFISTQWFPLSLGSIAVSTVCSLNPFTFQDNRILGVRQKVVNYGYRFQGSNHNSKSTAKGGEFI